MPLSRLRSSAKVSLLVFTASACFAWGFFAHRHRLFPFAWLQVSAIALGALRGEPGLEWRAGSGVRNSLLASPYLAGTIDPRSRAKGVLVLDSRRAMPGSTLLIAGAEGRFVANLFGLDGRVAWSWPLRGVERPQVAALLPEGDLLVLDQGRSLVRLDRRGRERWRVPGAFHHALTVLQGRITTLRGRPRVEPRIHPRAQVFDDEIVTLDPDGKELESVSILEGLLTSPYAFLLPGPADDELARMSLGRDPAELTLDILHANEVAPTGMGATGIEPLSRPGNWLVSIRNLNLLAVLDGRSHKVLWAWGPGRLFAQHHATLLPSGRLLVFNNGSERSEVLEIEPAGRRIAWSYSSADFFTSFGGGCQRLANGNTLITESMTGYVFEVTPEGERVWVWANPDIAPDGTRSAIYRATRYRTEELNWLPAAAPPPGAPVPP